VPIIIKKGTCTFDSGFAQLDSHVRCCHLVRPVAIDILEAVKWDADLPAVMWDVMP
jgi:hypothetical protein